MTSPAIVTPLRERRIRAGLSLRDVAAYADINRGHVSLLEQGRYFPPQAALGRYMAVLADFESLLSRRGAAPFLTPEERKARTRARIAVAKAVRDGTLIRESCQTCGNERTQAHHRWGYDDPLRVVWLCGPHHGSEHSAMNAERSGLANGARRESISAKSRTVKVKYGRV